MIALAKSLDNSSHNLTGNALPLDRDGLIPQPHKYPGIEKFRTNEWRLAGLLNDMRRADVEYVAPHALNDDPVADLERTTALSNVDSCQIHNIELAVIKRLSHGCEDLRANITFWGEGR